MAAVEFENPLGHIVEEVAIVGYRDDGGRIGLQIFLEPGDGFGVQVVGGFIQQQHVGRRQQQAAQRHAAFLAARELVDDGVPGRQAQRVGGDFQLALEFPAADGVDRILKFRLLLEQLVHLVRSSSGSANLSLISLKRATCANAPPSPSITTLRTSLLGSSCGSCGR